MVAGRKLFQQHRSSKGYKLVSQDGERVLAGVVGLQLTAENMGELWRVVTLRALKPMLLPELSGTLDPNPE